MADAMNADNLSRGFLSKRDIVNLIFKRKNQNMTSFDF